MKKILFTLIILVFGLVQGCKFSTLEDPNEGVSPSKIISLKDSITGDFFADGRPESYRTIIVNLGEFADPLLNITLSTDYGYWEGTNNLQSVSFAIPNKKKILKLYSSKDYRAVINVKAIVKSVDSTKPGYSAAMEIKDLKVRYPNDFDLDASRTQLKINNQNESTVEFTGYFFDATKNLYIPELTNGGLIFHEIISTDTNKLSTKDIPLRKFSELKDGKFSLTLKSISNKKGKFKIRFYDQNSSTLNKESYEFEVVD